jgi:hypothetical protein
LRYFLCAVCLLVPTLALAQSPADPPTSGDVTFSGTLRSRVYSWDWFQPSVGENQYEYSGNLLLLNIAQRRPGWSWDAELAVPALLWLPNAATAPAPQGALGLGSNYFSANGNQRFAAMAFPKLLYVQIDGLGGNENSSFQLGRFEFFDGMETVPRNATLAALKRDRIQQRLIGPFGFSDVGRSFDGIHYVYSNGPNNLTFLAALPTRGVFQVDGWGWNSTGFGYASYTREWGHGRHAADTRVFAIDYDDWRHIVKTDNNPASVKNHNLGGINIQTFGAHSVHALTTAAGTFDALGWGAVQTGRWGSQAQLAYAYDAEAGYQPAMLPSLKPWVRGGYTAGSGDANPNDSTHGTFFQLLPTPRPYALFPFYNMMNTVDRFGTLMLRPHRKIDISEEFHSLRLASRYDLWYAGGGVFQPWTFGYTGRPASGRRSLANVYDSTVQYRASKYASFTGYFGYAQGLAVIQQIYPYGPDGKFAYLETLIRF